MTNNQFSNPHSFPDKSPQTYISIVVNVAKKPRQLQERRNSNALEIYYLFPKPMAEIQRCVEEPGYLQQQIERYTPELLGRDVDTIVWQKMLDKMPHHGRAHDILSRLKKKRQPSLNAMIATALLLPLAVGLFLPTFS